MISHNDTCHPHKNEPPAGDAQPQSTTHTAEYATWRNRLSVRLGIRDIRLWSHAPNSADINTWFRLLHDSDKRVADQAAWLLCHSDRTSETVLRAHRSEMIQEVMHGTSDTRRRLLLSLLNRIPPAEELHIDYLNFCLEGILSAHYPPGIRAALIRQAYRLCLPYPELHEEFRLTISLLMSTPQPPSITCAVAGLGTQ